MLHRGPRNLCSGTTQLGWGISQEASPHIPQNSLEKPVAQLSGKGQQKPRLEGYVSTTTRGLAGSFRAI